MEFLVIVGIIIFIIAILNKKGKNTWKNIFEEIFLLMDDKTLFGLMEIAETKVAGSPNILPGIFIDVMLKFVVVAVKKDLNHKDLVNLTSIVMNDVKLSKIFFDKYCSVADEFERERVTYLQFKNYLCNYYDAIS